MIRAFYERYRFRIYSFCAIAGFVFFLVAVWFPLLRTSLGVLTMAAADQEAYRRLSHTVLPPDSLASRYRDLSQRIAEFGSGKAKPSDVLQRIMSQATSDRVVIQDMSTRDPVATLKWTEYPVNMRARGSFFSVVSFLANLENGALCVSIASVALSPVSQGVEANVALSVFAPAEEAKP